MKGEEREITFLDFFYRQIMDFANFTPIIKFDEIADKSCYM